MSEKERKNMYTPQQTHEILDIAPSTLRRYVNLYGDYLSENARVKSKSRRYTEHDILILEKIKNLGRARKTRDEIIAAIQVVDEDQQPGDSLAMIPAIAQAFDNIGAQLIAAYERQEEQQAEIDQLKERLAELEKPWWRRILRRQDSPGEAE